MTPADRTTLRTACEAAIERAEGKQSQPLILLPAAMVVEMLDMAEQTPGQTAGLAPSAASSSVQTAGPVSGVVANAGRPGLFGEGVS